MAKNWMGKVEDRIIRESKSSAIHYKKATELTDKIRSKYNCGLADLPIEKLSDREKKTVYKAWLELGYSKESASLVVYGNTYQHALLNLSN